MNRSPRGRLTDRLDLLERSGVITPRARLLTVSTIGRIEGSLGLALDEDNGAVLVTHVGMALSRVERGEPEPDIPEVVVDEIAERYLEHELAASLVAEWSAALGRPIPDAELSYLVVHLSVLRDQERPPGIAGA